MNNTIAVVSEAFVLAVKAGADPQKVYQAIRGGLAKSAVLDAKLPMILETPNDDEGWTGEIALFRQMAEAPLA